MYLQMLLSGFCALRPEHDFFLFTPEWASPLLEHQPDNLRVVALKHVPVSRPVRTVYQQTGFAAAISRCKLDAFFASATVAPLLIQEPVTVAVQFLQFYQWPETYGSFRTAYLRWLLPRTVRRASRVITFSESAKADLVRWAGADRTKVRVVPHGVSEDIWDAVAKAKNKDRQHLRNLFTAGRPYVVCVSATYTYKNHERLVRAFALLKRQFKSEHALLLVGSEVNVSYAYLQQIAAVEKIPGDLFCAGRLNELSDVASAYLGADVAVMPSLYETFGYPVLEAMASGCPVVTSNTGTMAEIAGDAAVLVDPLSVTSIAEGIGKLLKDPAQRASLVPSGFHRARDYKWERSVRTTLHVIEETALR
jgi:glycosyltransferase involved in cell wall biosynthesis